jgi:hypothetical protein
MIYGARARKWSKGALRKLISRRRRGRSMPERNRN